MNYVCLLFFCVSTLSYASQKEILLEIFTEEHFSPLYETKPLRREDSTKSLLEALQRLGCTSLVDAGCGEASWVEDMSPSIQYRGLDILSRDILGHKKFLLSHIHFIEADITTDTIPQADMILCRDCLEYFSYGDIYFALKNFVASGSSYVMLSNCLEDNRDVATGIKRGVNLQASPFFFPDPELIVSRESPEGKMLAVWKTVDIPIEQVRKRLFPPVTVLSKPVQGSFSWEHPAVAESIRRGFAQLGSEYNFNPTSVADIKSNVVVIADIRAAMQAYEWKRAGKIQKLFVGPNLLATPLSEDRFVQRPLLDGFVCPSQWVVDNFIRYDARLQKRGFIWPAGVDGSHWKPKTRRKEKKGNCVLVYRKTHPELCDEVEKALMQRGYEVLCLTYGKYSLGEYKEALEKAKYAVIVSVSESQGIFLAEAWCMDVPTLVWNPQTPITYQGFVFTETSAAPYLHPLVGREWKTIEDLEDLLDSFSEYEKTFQPRRWALLHMTDKHSVEILLSMFR